LHSKSKAKSEAKAKAKVKSSTKHQTKAKGKSKFFTKSLDEISFADQQVSRSELDDAARAIEESENEDLEEIFRNQGADDVVSTLSKEDEDRKWDTAPDEERTTDQKALTDLAKSVRTFANSDVDEASEDEAP
jgi:hypothetical protein